MDSSSLAVVATRVGDGLRHDGRLPRFLHEVCTDIDSLDGLYLTRGAVRDYVVGATPDDFDLMPAVDQDDLPELARRFACPDRTFFGGYRRPARGGRPQIDLFIPVPSLASRRRSNLLSALDSFAFSCDAIGYDLITGAAEARPEVTAGLLAGSFWIQSAYLAQANDDDLAYTAIKAIWIMGHCNLEVSRPQTGLVRDGLELIGAAPSRHVTRICRAIDSFGPTFLDRLGPLRSPCEGALGRWAGSPP